MNIQDSPKQIALTSDQLEGIKKKYNEMVSKNTMAPAAEVVSPEPVVPTVEPTPAPTPEAVNPAPAAVAVNEPVAPESVSPNIFDIPENNSQDIGNIFDAPQAPETPVVPEQPTNAEIISNPDFNVFDVPQEPTAPAMEPVSNPVEPTPVPTPEVVNEMPTNTPNDNIKDVSYEKKLSEKLEESLNTMYEMEKALGNLMVQIQEELEILKEKGSATKETTNLFDNPENTMHM